MTARSGGAIAVPLLLAPSFDAKTWGGRRLESFGKRLPPGSIGESLETGANAVVVNGPFSGERLGDLAQTHAPALLGRFGQRVAMDDGDFPLLIKLIDAHEHLSVQVHPDDVQAPAGKRGKTEAWYILDAEPGASIVTGIVEPIQIDRIHEQLVETVVTPGEVYFVPAGTVHAIGAGVLLYEIQQASDVTWRLFDWGRSREIHVTAALGAIRQGQRATRVTPLRMASGRDMLVACRHFALERWSVDGDAQLHANRDSFRVLTVLSGSLNIAEFCVERGSTLVLPADISSQSMRGSGTFLLGYIPDLDADVRRPLLAAGHDHASIERLGEVR